MNIYCGNLPYSMTEDDLRQLFSEHGEISSAAVITDKFSGQSKGFGFVEMPNDAEAESAIESLNGTEVNGRTLKINQARPREDGPRRPRN